jgi:hypothetical protein
MSRWWNEFFASVGEVVGLPLLVLGLLAAATVVAALWYWFPAWVPRHLPRLRRPRWRLPRWRRPRLNMPRWRWPGWRWPRLRWPQWRRWLLRWRRREAEPAAEPEVVQPVAGAELPDLSAEAFASLADRLAAEGRYAEAVRERLRSIVRELVDRGVIEHRPGWTVTELAAAAGSARPTVAAPLAEAAAVFSDIWYGQRPAHATHDDRMRALAGDVHAALANGAGRGPVGAGTAASGGRP